MQKFTQCKEFGANFYAVQSFCPSYKISAKFYTQVLTIFPPGAGSVNELVLYVFFLFSLGYLKETCR